MIEIQNLTLGYDRHPAVHHLNAVVEHGALLALIGPNGAGKSSLLKGIMGLLKPIGGRIVQGSVTQQQIAYLPQQIEIDRAFPITVADMVAMGLWHRVGAFRAVGVSKRLKIDAALGAVGMDGFGGRTIASLSGGQFQRMLFARLLLQDAQLILLDEPFAAVDAKTAAALLELIQRWHNEERTVNAVLHDLGQVRRHFPQALLLARKLIAYGATSAVLREENLLLAQQMTEAFDPEAAFCQQVQP